MKWVDMQEREIDLEEKLRPYIGTSLIHIGTDAQTKGTYNVVDHVTVICVHKVNENGIGAGGIILHWTDRQIPTHSLWEKLYGETERSLRVAVKLEEIFGKSISDTILVHVDANPNPIFKSSSYVKQLAGMVMGYGFKHVLKPEAWAASHAADHIVKGKHNGR